MKKVKLSLIIIISFLCNQIHAQAPTRDRQKEEKIEKQLGEIDTSLVPIFKKATIAMDNQNYKLADSLYSIVYAKAPNFDPVVRRHGSLQLSLGNIKEGLNL